MSGLGLTATIKPNIMDRKLGGPALRFPNSRTKRNMIQLALHRLATIYIHCEMRAAGPQRISIAASLCGCGRGLAAACGVSTGT